MADTGLHYYLQLHHKVEGDLRILSLTPSERDLFTRMRLMALQGDTPGEINLSWEGLLACLGVRSSKRRERLTLRLIEERRLLSRATKDGLEVLVIARWTMPQLEQRASRNASSAAQEFTAPRPKYPSDAPERRSSRREPEPAAGPQSPLVQQFYAAPDAPVQAAESSAELSAESAQTPHSTAECPIYNRKENSSKSKAESPTPHTPHTVLSEEQSAAAAFLISEGIDPPTAERFAQEGATEAICAQAVEAVNARNPKTNRAGMLRRAVEFRAGRISIRSALSEPFPVPRPLAAGTNRAACPSPRTTA